MASIQAIADGLAARLDTVAGLRVFSFVPDAIEPPTVFLNLGEITPETFGYDTWDVPFDAVVLVARASGRVGQSNLYGYCSPAGAPSIWVAIAADQSLGLSDGTKARIARYRPLGVEEVAAYGYYGGAFEIKVTTPGA